MQLASLQMQIQAQGKTTKFLFFQVDIFFPTTCDFRDMMLPTPTNHPDAVEERNKGTCVTLDDLL